MKKVSVLITTYNHEEYIAEALESVLRQKTDFDFEILVGEDDSKDRTREICRDYAKKHGDKIRLFLNDRKNVIYIDGKPTGRWNFLNLLKHAEGAYIARCDGDDYWTDENKLQQMVDFMDSHPDHAVCFHQVQWLKNGQFESEPAPPPPGKTWFSADDLFLHDSFIRTSAVLYRNVLNGKMPDWFHKVVFGDISMHLIHSQFGKIGYLPQIMGVYRVHNKGVYSSSKPIVNWLKAIKTYTIAADNLGYADRPSFKQGMARLYQAIAGEAAQKARRLQAEAAAAEKKNLTATQSQHDVSDANPPLVSVIVPTYNRPEGLRAALKSIAGQTYPNVEAVVVNDAGADVQNVTDEFKSELNITYVNHESNKHLAAARNTGIRHAAGTYIAYLDDDDVFFPGHLQAAMDVLLNSDYRVVYTDAFRAHQYPLNGNYVTRYQDLPYSTDFDRERLLLNNYFPVLCVVHEKSCLNQSGLFDESLRTQEDWDLWIRLSRNFDFYHIRKITAAFAWRADGSSMSGAIREKFVDTTKTIYEKYSDHVQGKQALIDYQQRHLQNLLQEVEAMKKAAAGNGKAAALNTDFRGPLVSVIIPLYNQLEYTQRCIKALIQNTIYAPYQLVLVDDASTDGTADFLRALHQKNPGIKIVINEKNLGFAATCNRGAAAADGQYLVFLNNDTEVQRDWLVHLAVMAYNDPQVGAVGSKLMYPDRTIQHAGVLVTRDEKNNNLLSPWHIYNGNPADFAAANQPFIYQAVTGACLFIDKHLFEEAGRFDEQYRNGYEDVDLCFKIGQMGKHIVYQPDSVVIHHESKSGPERFAHMGLNRQLLEQRWLSEIQPDTVVTKDGKAYETENMPARPYTNWQRPVKPDSGRWRVGYLSLDRDEFACPQLRLIGPLDALQDQQIIEHVKFNFHDKDQVNIDLNTLRSLDILIVQRNFIGAYSFDQLVQALGEQRPKIIFEFDDALDKLPHTHPGYDYYNGLKTRFEAYIRNAEMVTVSTAELKQYYLSWNKNIVVLPNTLQKKHWSANITNEKTDDTVRLLFAGTNTHAADFKTILPAVKQIFDEFKDKVELLLWGEQIPQLAGYSNVKTAAGFQRDYGHYLKTLQGLNADIALAPLEVNDFNRAKSNIKWLEYSAAGIAGIYADLPAYNRDVVHDENGLLAGTEASDWYKAMKELITDSEKRERLAQTAQAMVWQQYDLENNVHQWRDVFSRLMNQSKADNAVSKKKEANDRETQPDQKPRHKSARHKKVSIIIPVFNKLELTRNCIASIEQNTDSADYELIVVDNASTDGTAEYLKQLQADRDHVTVISNSKNAGFASANNQAAKEAAGKYLLFLNNDTEVQPGWLTAMLSVVEKDANVGAVGSKLLYPDNKIQHTGVWILDHKPSGDPLLAMNSYINQPADFAPANQIATYQAVTGACMLVDAQLYQELGGFDEGFWNGYEDVDLCFRIREKGKQIIYQPQSVVTHFESKSGAERFSKVGENIERLHQKWLGKITTDFLVDETGDIHPAANPVIKPYTAECKEVRQSDDDLVSIIMLTYNALDYTKKAVDSIQKNTTHPYELILVDNGSTDGSKKYLRKLQKQHDNVKIILNKANKGFAAGNNQGLQKAAGKYVLFLNNDILVAEGWLESLVQVLEADPLIGMVGPITNHISGLQMVREVPYKDEDGFYDFAAQVRKVNDRKWTPRRRIAGFAMLMPSKLCRDLGGFDASFGSGNFEDDDLCLRLREQGYAIMVDESTFIHHYGSQTFKANNIDYSASLDEKKSLFRQKWPDVDYDRLLEIKEPLSAVHTQTLNEAISALQNGETGQAEKLYDRVVEENPLDAEALFGRALCRQQKGEIEAAASDYRKLIERSTKNASVYNQYGICMMHADETAEALTAFETAILLDKNLLEAQRNYAEALIADGQYEAGVKTYMQIIQNHSDDVPALLALAGLYFEAQRPDEARALIERALEIDGSNVTARKFMQLLSDNGKPQDKAESHKNLSLLQAHHLLEQGNAEAAEKIYIHSITENPGHIEAMFGLALCKRLREQWTEAIALFEKIIRLEPEFREAYNNMASIALLNNAHDSAIQWYIRSLEINPGQLPVKRQLIDLLISQKKYDEAVQLLMNTVQENPADVETLLQAGALHYEAGKVDESKQYFSRVLELDPGNHRAQEFLEIAKSEI